MFGDERLNGLIRNHNHLNGDALLGVIVDTVKKWAGVNEGQTLEDDITMIVMDILPDGRPA